jgi:conjugative transfer region protein TrbK
MKVAATTLTTVVLFAGCGERASPPEIKAETLAADPERLQETLKRCKADRAAVGDATCRAASEAYRKRFMGSGKSNYDPQSVDLFPQTPDKATPRTTSKSASKE